MKKRLSFEAFFGTGKSEILKDSSGLFFKFSFRYFYFEKSKLFSKHQNIRLLKVCPVLKTELF
jgi:hypothetical protein